MATGTNVFISYASDTKPLAEELTRALESQGIEPWVDFKDLHPGQRWREEMERAIDAAQWFVILVGSKSLATPWQEAEWSAALARSWADREKKLLPVVFGEGDPPPFLRNWVSLRIDPEREASTWTRHVLGALRNLRNEAVHSMDPQSWEERHERLNDVRKAAEELRKGQPDKPPAIQPQVQSE
jgi:hypothetical protein